MRVLVGDITRLKDVESIVNAANGVGPMGLGVAGAISEAGGPELRNDVRQICTSRGNFDPGECYISIPGKLASRGISSVYHAVTMKYPGSPTSVEIVQKAMRATLQRAVLNGVKSIAFPGLGTGVGQLPKEKIAREMVSVANEFVDSIDVTIIDIDKEFIDFVKESQNTEEIS